MAKYFVEIQTEERSELADIISITGLVNGVQVAAKVRISKLPKPLKAITRQKQFAMIAAYSGRQVKLSTTGDEVEVE